MTAPAAVVLDAVLGLTEGLDVRDGLVAESLAYSMLLAGPEFAAWLAARGAPRPRDEGDRVRLARDGDTLRITLARPARRNAVDAAMRDALVEALSVAVADPDLAVVITGEGPDFCSGGDLDEFGTTPDPVTAHLIRTSHSPAWLLHSVRDRVEVRVHGACIGAGVELAAFAGRVTATPDAWFALPELSMGLIPGAGGTVSLPRRIGAERTQQWVRSGQRIDAQTALDWRLIDAITN